jgi:hypothetical protein
MRGKDERGGGTREEGAGGIKMYESLKVTKGREGRRQVSVASTRPTTLRSEV